MLLGDSAEREICQLIERRNLHANLGLCLPVPIRQVATDEGWHIYYKEAMGALYGAAVVDGPVRIMTINADLSREWQRHAIAHEMGHVINGDPSCIHTFHKVEWITTPIERRASIVAAKLLIPTAALEEMGSLAEIAYACEVPCDLVELRVHNYEVGTPRLYVVPEWTSTA